jgi:hypothetical protein
LRVLLLDNPEIAFANRCSLARDPMNLAAAAPAAQGVCRLLSFRPGDQFTAAVLADAIHAGGAAGTEGAFITADPGIATG